jgi:hypothetical protein
LNQSLESGDSIITVSLEGAAELPSHRYWELSIPPIFIARWRRPASLLRHGGSYRQLAEEALRLFELPKSARSQTLHPVLRTAREPEEIKPFPCVRLNGVPVPELPPGRMEPLEEYSGDGLVSGDWGTSYTWSRIHTSVLPRMKRLPLHRIPAGKSSAPEWSCGE